MKNFLKSKGFLVSALILSCIGILIACWYVSRDQTSDFQPAETSNVIQSQNWEEHQETAEGHTEETNSSEAYVIPKDSNVHESPDAYPIVSEVSESEVSIDFTPTETQAQSPPPLPEGKRFWKMQDRSIRLILPLMSLLLNLKHLPITNRRQVIPTKTEPFMIPYSAG